MLGALLLFIIQISVRTAEDGFKPDEKLLDDLIKDVMV
jgi:hypothetical protein